MQGASKILTVSYGTFSCTLEGFDDPFNTMRAIAEYFRDLAAGDRYFGAEPPTPDAAMLHRIAEREVQRRVEARVEDNNVILRAAEEPAAAAIAAPIVAENVAKPGAAETPVAEAPVAQDPVVEPAAETVAVEPLAPVDIADELPEVPAAPVEPLVADAPEPVEPPARPALAEVMPEGVAVKLARLRHAVALSGAAAAPVAANGALPVEDAASAFAPSFGSDGFDEEDDADIGGTAGLAEAFDVANVKPEAAFVAKASDDVQGDADAQVLARLGGLMVDEDEVLESTDSLDEDDEIALQDRAEPPTASPLTLGDEGVELADLIAELTGKPAAAAAGAEPAAPEVETAPSQAAELQEDWASEAFAEDIEQEDEELFGLAAAPAPAWQHEGSPDVADLGDDLESELSAALFDDADDAAPEVVTPVEEAEEPLAAAWSDDAQDIDLQEVAGDDTANEVDAEPLAAAQVEPQFAEPVEAEETATVAPAPHDAALEKAQRARARVIKIRRADAMLPETADEPTAFVAPVADQPVEADTTTTAPDEDMTRLLRQADDEMSEPSNRRRLSAIQHLKAAVAATVAERLAGVKEPSDAERADPYRADLARAVRPVRPRSNESERTPRLAATSEQRLMSSTNRPAPLVLVSEQRIDRSAAPSTPVHVAPVHVAPVRPRRVGRGGAVAAASGGEALQDDYALEAELSAALLADEPALPEQAGSVMQADLDLNASEDDVEPALNAGNIFDDSRGFAEFAERLGTSNLTQMLEAAAAYATCFGKRDHFTRPYLMRQVEAGRFGDGFTREDGLRGFGTLLREGRFAKVGRGHFVLTDDSTYLAEARKMAR
ncbi:hypothetical protein Q9295_05195 [Xinfangfangia sp. CPCC 101601]|uniref:Chemotaxis protein CheA n=1 Tax=Pseudogemmobacter lacusdianii TaxID=3069608 RepID=A0ABU0VVJ7_9RHOB|nr:hypothetical protein [Xinfangfangia sp. CPCC 101601]MDQ2065757.1 hypothetical protein [Xinfangfangia sp. CPCC 101601]